MKSVSCHLSLVLFLLFASYGMVDAAPQPSTMVSSNATLVPNGTCPFSKLGLKPAIFKNVIMNYIRLPTYRNPLPIPFRRLYLLSTREHLHHWRPRSRNLCISPDIALYLSSIPNMHSRPLKAPTTASCYPAETACTPNGCEYRHPHFCPAPVHKSSALGHPSAVLQAATALHTAAGTRYGGHAAGRYAGATGRGHVRRGSAARRLKCLGQWIMQFVVRTARFVLMTWLQVL